MVNVNDFIKLLDFFWLKLIMGVILFDNGSFLLE